MAQEKLIIDQAAWSEAVAELLLPACPVIAEVKRQVDEKLAKLFCVYRDGVAVGAFVLRVDEMHLGFQGVIVAAAGRDEINLTDNVLPVVETMFKGCYSVRVHTKRRGLAKKLMERYGYRFDEIVLTKVFQ